MESDRTITYELGGKTFRLVAPIARQQKWLWPIVKPIMMAGHLTGEDLQDLLFEQGPLMAAILLLEEGQTQVQKVEAGWERVRELELWFSAMLPAKDLAPVLRDFLALGLLQQMLLGLADLLPTSLMTGSTKPSAPSPTETSSAPTGSGATPG